LRIIEAKRRNQYDFAAAPSQEEFLSQLILDKRIEWKRINAFHMDEYIGIRSDAPQSFGNFLRQRIFDKVPFKRCITLMGMPKI
jgi:glucosamine-6-phosphate deaminase